MNLDILIIPEKISEIIDREQYRKLFARDTYYLWNQLWQLINYTKAYQLGLEISCLFLNKFTEYKADYREKEQEHQLIQIYSAFLTMLDKADMWEDYLKNWEIIKHKSIEMKLGIFYDISSYSYHVARGAQDYFIEYTANGFTLSFLYILHSRRDLIAKKLQKSKKGCKISNLLHEQQNVLNQDEIKERYDWLVNYFRTGSYDYCPPASIQKEKKRQNKLKTKVLKSK